jgi:hypothetical protein
LLIYPRDFHDIFSLVCAFLHSFSFISKLILTRSVDEINFKINVHVLLYIKFRKRVWSCMPNQLLGSTHGQSNYGDHSWTVSTIAQFLFLTHLSWFRSRASSYCLSPGQVSKR